MAKAYRIGLWVAVVGIALTAQGCWDEQQETMTLLGEGGCRTADGGDGEPDYMAGISMEECRAQCVDAETACTAFEYNANNSNCEIHHHPISKVAATKGVSCYVAN